MRTLHRYCALSAELQQITKELSKPERYLIVELAANPAMLFGGTDEEFTDVKGSFWGWNRSTF